MRRALVAALIPLSLLGGTPAAGTPDRHRLPGVHDAAEDWRFADALDAASLQLDARLRRHGPAHPATAEAHLAIARVLMSVDRHRAREQLRYTLGLLGPEPETAPIRAAVLVELGRSDTGPEGTRRLAEARRILLRADAQGSLAWADLRHAEGRAEWRRGNLLDAERAYREATGIRAAHLGPGHAEVVSTLVWLAHIVESQGRLPEATALVERALRGRLPAPLVVTAHNWLATDAAARGDLATADSLLDGVATWLRGHRVATQADFASRRSDFGLANLAALRLGQQRPDEAWRTLEAAREWTTGAFAALGRAACGNPRLDRLADRILDLERRLRSDPEAHLVRAALWRVEADRLLLERDELGRLVRDRPAARDPLDELQRQLAPGEAVLGWCEMRFQTTPGDSAGRYARWAHVIRNRGPVEWIPLGRWRHRSGFQELHERLRELRRMIERAAAWPVRAETDPQLDELAASVSEELLGPVLESLRGAERLIVLVPAGWGCPPLSCLPLPGGDHVVDRFAVSYASSGGLLAALRASAPAPAERSPRSLVVGDALYETPAPFDQGSNPWEHLHVPHGTALDLAVVRGAASGREESLDRLPALPFSGYEVSRVSSLLPAATVLAGADASERRIDAMRREGALADFDVIHVAAHALWDAIPERNALALSRPARVPAPGRSDDGLVTAREILLGWTLSARLVTLSGCQTSGSGGTLDGPFGFRQALLRAGARAIVDSQWKVDDVATALLMGRFYSNLAAADGKPPSGLRSGAAARALSEAERWLRDLESADGRRPFSHPAYWSSFVLFGSPD